MIILNKNSDVKIPRTAYNNSGGVLDVSAATITAYFRESQITSTNAMVKLSSTSQIDLSTNGVYIINLDADDFALLNKKNYYVSVKIVIGTDAYRDQFVVRVEGNRDEFIGDLVEPTTVKTAYVIITSGVITTEVYYGFDTDPTAAVTTNGADSLILSSTTSELYFEGIPSSNNLDWNTITQTTESGYTVAWDAGAFTGTTVSFLWTYYSDASRVTTGALTYGTTADRPVFASGTNIGFVYYDITISAPVWWSGTAWSDE